VLTHRAFFRACAKLKATIGRQYESLKRHLLSRVAATLRDAFAPELLLTHADEHAPRADSRANPFAGECPNLPSPSCVRYATPLRHLL